MSPSSILGGSQPAFSAGGRGDPIPMPQKAWSNKRERQYEHVKEGAKERGASTKRAKEIAARTVNKERARSGGRRSRPASRRPTPRRAGAEAGAPAPPARRGAPRSSSPTRP